MKIYQLINFYFNKAKIENSFGSNWELFKYESGKYLRAFGSKLAKTRKVEEQNIISDISLLSQTSPDSLTEEDKIKLYNLQEKLDAIYRRRAEGAFIRSRKQWLEKGEQNSSYFFNLEKYHAKSNTINELIINDNKTDDPKIISDFCSTFYKKLYTSNYSENDTLLFFNSLQHTSHLNDSDVNICDLQLSHTEISDGINLLKANKSPGTDGLSSEFYKLFSQQLAPFLLQVFNESLLSSTLPASMTQGLINLIPKPQKDPLYIDNWRPICLLNNDYKILALILAKRIKKVLDTLIDETQSGFMPYRHITNNIRLVLDIIDYSHLISDNSFILFLDFFKAFDTVEHNFLFHTLDKFGFGGFFCNAIKTLYNKANCSIKLKFGSSPRFAVNRGVRQGCPISPYLFLLAAQLLCDHIKHSNLQGISIADRTILISQLADDTTLFLRESSQIPIAIDIIKQFSKASGLSLNLKKCELLAIKDCSVETISSIPIKNSVTYLGIIIDKNESQRCHNNFTSIVDKTKKKFNQWLLRDLSLRGRILLSKAEGLSRLTYAALSLGVESHVCKTIDKILFDFVWKNRTHYLKKSVIMKDYSKGGLNLLDFTSLNYTFKINWINRYFKSPTSLWNFIPHYVFSSVGGLQFLLLCTFNADKLPIKLSSFHKQMLLAWCLIYKHNFTPHRFFIWNNKYILYKNKSIFLQQWFDSNIVLLSQLFDQHGRLYNYAEFMQRYGIPVTPKDFSIVFDAVPSGVISLFKNPDSHNNLPILLNVTETAIGKACFMSNNKNRNKIIRQLFQQNIISTPSALSYWSTFIGDINWEKVWLLPHKFLLTNKVKEISFKMLHRFYPTNHYIQRLKKDNDVNCKFCDSVDETLVHLFWSCPLTRKLWSKLVRFVREHIYRQFDLCWKNVLFGFIEYDKNLNSQFYLINLLVILTKFYIHRTKFSGKKPNLPELLAYLKQYVISISDCENKKAVKTYNLFKLYKIFDE